MGLFKDNIRHVQVARSVSEAHTHRFLEDLKTFELFKLKFVLHIKIPFEFKMLNKAQ